MKRALLVTAAAVLLSSTPAFAVGYCGQQGHQDLCGRANIYPCCNNGSNCTWWAWESVCRNWRMGLVNWGNANTWHSHARVDPRFDVIGSPVVGSIATSTLGSFGHVAWVVGTGAGTVTVTEQNCCASCGPTTRQFTYANSRFNSGFVVRKGTQCACSPGQVQTQACGNCGTTSRSCDGCNWGGWSGCNGPDPAGGTQICDNGSLGACKDARNRCVGGNLTCRSLKTPTGELCDGIDNDCDGEVDEGNPTELGPNGGEYAAKLVDMSWPQSLKRGERATVWAAFKNVGTRTWPARGIWLSARGSKEGQLSNLYPEDQWPAWNVAAELEQAVAPGELGRFQFEVVAPDEAGLQIDEKFQLQVAAGEMIACPSADISPSIRVMNEAVTPEQPAPTMVTPKKKQTVAQSGGCSSVPGFSLLFPLALLARFCRRRG